MFYSIKKYNLCTDVFILYVINYHYFSIIVLFNNLPQLSFYIINAKKVVICFSVFLFLLETCENAE